MSLWVHAPVHVRRSEDNLLESLLLPRGLWGLMLGHEGLYSLTHLTSSYVKEF
ncbi:hypothetical protein I79_001586 [Cricetulus griseus]|uniref:Uncharacterized protein n=1 Tax=Cricetulus griseus TaxID=10029 RepID=G3GV55_CRIGR|nr:hypothetical protein I79_001586 [Cricetulus griseus]